MATTRLIQRLREHDWLAVLVELAVVVLGILIALQVSNWNQARIDRTRAHDYTARIHGELLTDRQNMDVTLAFWAKASDYGREAIAHGETGALVDGSPWKTVLAYYQASQTFPFVGTDSAFTEMRGAGDLGLIADPRLRARIASYYSPSGIGGQSIIHEQDPEYRRQVRGLTPWSVQEYIWDHCFSGSGFFTEQFVDCPSPISDQEATAILSRYQQDPTLLDHLRFWMSQLRISSLVLVNDRREASNLAAAVGREAGLPANSSHSAATSSSGRP